MTTTNCKMCKATLNKEELDSKILLCTKCKEIAKEVMAKRKAQAEMKKTCGKCDKFIGPVPVNYCDACLEDIKMFNTTIFSEIVKLLLNRKELGIDLKKVESVPQEFFKELIILFGYDMDKLKMTFDPIGFQARLKMDKTTIAPEWYSLLEELQTLKKDNVG